MVECYLPSILYFLYILSGMARLDMPRKCRQDLQEEQDVEGQDEEMAKYSSDRIEYVVA